MNKSDNPIPLITDDKEISLHCGKLGRKFYGWYEIDGKQRGNRSYVIHHKVLVQFRRLTRVYIKRLLRQQTKRLLSHNS